MQRDETEPRGCEVGNRSAQQKPTGVLSCGMSYWLPDGVTLAGVNALFDNPRAAGADFAPALGVLDAAR